MPEPMKGPVTIMFMIFTVLFCGLPTASSQNMPYVETYFEQYVDHFNFLSYRQQTFKQRVLIQGKLCLFIYLTSTFILKYI